jgi:type VI secretion system ImpB/VipA family protein
MNFEFSVGKASRPAQPRDPTAPHRLLVLGDLSGRGNRGLREPLASRRVISLDIDNFDGVLAKYNPALNVALPAAPGGQVTIRFESLEDFHPDRLLQRVTPLSELLRARQELQSPATAAAGAESLQRLLGGATVSEKPVEAAAAKTESSEDTLARLLGKAPSSGERPASPGAKLDVEAFVKRIAGATAPVQPSVRGAAGLLAAADLELASRLRALLHHHDFQTLEGVWRGLDFLLRRRPDEEGVKLFVLDATLEELATDATGLHEVLRGQPWTGVVGNYTFEATQADLEKLAVLGSVCASVGSTFVAGAGSPLVGCDSFAEHPDPDDWRNDPAAEVRELWTALRATPAAANTALVLPRFLLRQPYGQDSDPIDSFPFEEIPDGAANEAFLWGNSAFLVALQQAQACVGPGEEPCSEIDGLPVYRFREAGETAVKPCAEAWLTERAAARIVAQGLIAVQSVKGRDAVTLTPFQTLHARAEGTGRDF